MAKGLFSDIYSLLDEIPLGVAVLDDRRRVLFVNRRMEALTGCSRNDSRGVSCHDILRVRACVQGCPLAAGKTAGRTSFDSDLINRDRRRVSVRVTQAPLRDGAGQVAGFVETIEDIAAVPGPANPVGQPFSLGKILGNSAQMARLFQILPVIAQSDSSALITGETGTGKDLVAETIHQVSARHKGPFVKINCGALPETLLESELFGHEKGAFTGAVGAKPGRFHLAHNGTLYLTEIGDLPLPLQVKLLTFLDDRVVFPLGSTKAVAANVRIIAATHLDLEQMVRDGRFRQDLYFRLNVVRIHLPALREREGDIALLIGHFLNSLIGKLGRDIKGLSRQAQRLLNDYDYPGNVRELMNILEYSVNVCKGQTVQVDDLPAYLTPKGAAGRPPLSPRPAVPLGQSHGPVPDQHQQPSGDGGKWPQMERQLILNALTRTGGRKSQAAALLGWSRITFWRKMKAHGVNP